jgi:predicted MFS family arabinose efflux permease
VALVWGIVSAGIHGWGSFAALGPIALGLVLLAVFLVIEGRVAASPLVPLRVFSDRLLRTANLAVLVFSAALFPMWYFLSLYLQEVLRFPPIGAGLAFLPMALTIMACAGYSGRLVQRFGPGPVLGGGLALMACGMALFARIAVNGGYLSDVVLPSLLVSSGIGFSVVPSTIAATATAEPQNAGLASGLVNTSRQIGGALGLAILTSLAAGYTHHLVNADFRAPVVALTDGFRLAFLIGAGFAACGAAIAFRFLPEAARATGAAQRPPAAAAERAAPAIAQTAGAPAPAAERGASSSPQRAGAGGSMSSPRGAPESGG